MKHIYLALIASFFVFNSMAQSVASFDDLTLSPGSFWNGSDQSGSFKSGAIGGEITNSTYAYLSMKNSDSFSKKFGGETGNDPDYFKLMIEGLNGNGLPVDTICFYLADFRFDDNSKDYILKNWSWVDLNSLKVAKKLRFSLSSSDNAAWGMNTPGYFCIDNLNYEIMVSAPEIQQIQASVIPNPFTDRIIISGIKANANVSVFNVAGSTICEHFNVSNNQVINGLEKLRSDVYFIKITEGKNQSTFKMIKE